MRRYFFLKAEVKALNATLEQERQARGESIERFYDPQRNLAHAGDLIRSHQIKGEMVRLMSEAEALARED